jgi:hypothetical protein
VLVRPTKVRRRLRPCLPQRRDRRDPHTRARAECERTRRALGRQRPSRVPRPATHLQAAPARTGASRLCPSLQPASAAPLARTSATRTGRPKPDGSTSTTMSAAQSPGPTRRPDPRIRTRSLTRSISPSKRSLRHILLSRLMLFDARARIPDLPVDVKSTPIQTPRGHSQSRQPEPRSTGDTRSTRIELMAN